MDWGFIWIMFVLKIPVIALLWLVWWAIRQTDDPAAEEGSGGDGGSKLRQPRHPRPKQPWSPRCRGPHGDPSLPAPPRVRTVVRARERVGPRPQR